MIQARSTHRQVILDPVDSSRMNGADSDRPESAISSNPADGVLSEMKMIQNSILAAVKTGSSSLSSISSTLPIMHFSIRLKAEIVFMRFVNKMTLR